MASAPTITEPDATATAPLANRRRTQRVVVVYILLALLAVVIGIAVGVRRHDTAAIGNITVPTAQAAPTEQAVIATAPPGMPTPTPLATRAPSPTSASPTEAATPIAPTVPALTAPARSAPVVNVNQNRQGAGKGKGKGKGGDGRN